MKESKEIVKFIDTLLDNVLSVSDSYEFLQGYEQALRYVKEEINNT